MASGKCTTPPSPGRNWTGRFWWPLAASLVLIYPGFKGALHLGQNAPLTLFILIWGWALLARRHPVAGGIVGGYIGPQACVWAKDLLPVPFMPGMKRSIEMPGIILLQVLPPSVDTDTPARPAFGSV